MIRKPGSQVEAEICQTATGTGGQESRSGTEGFDVLGGSGEAGRSGTGVHEFGVHEHIQSSRVHVERRSLYRPGNRYGTGGGDLADEKLIE